LQARVNDRWYEITCLSFCCCFVRLGSTVGFNFQQGFGDFLKITQLKSRVKNTTQVDPFCKKCYSIRITGPLLHRVTSFESLNVVTWVDPLIEVTRSLLICRNKTSFFSWAAARPAMYLSVCVSFCIWTADEIYIWIWPLYSTFHRTKMWIGVGTQMVDIILEIQILCNPAPVNGVIDTVYDVLLTPKEKFRITSVLWSIDRHRAQCSFLTLSLDACTLICEHKEIATKAIDLQYLLWRARSVKMQQTHFCCLFSEVRHVYEC